MKKLLLLALAIMLLLPAIAKHQDKVLGTWLTQHGDSKVTIKKDAMSKFYGEITWLKEPNKDGKPKVDDKNPDAKLQNRPIMGLRMLDGFVYKDKQWVDGTIYNPKEGKTYKCNMWFYDGNYNLLHVKGYIGFSFIGKEVEWTRSN